MCTTFHCSSCDNDFFNRCSACLIESREHCGNTSPISCATCEPCERVTSAIAQLEALVFKAPFLVEKGLSGLEDLQEWERAGFEDLLVKKRHDWASEAQSLAGRMEMQEKIRAMNLDGVEDARDGRKPVPAAAQTDGDDKDDDPIAEMLTRHNLVSSLIENYGKAEQTWSRQSRGRMKSADS